MKKIIFLLTLVFCIGFASATYVPTYRIESNNGTLFDTNDDGTDDIVFDNSGRVGIGTDSPTTKLYVKDSPNNIAWFESTATNNISRIVLDGAGGYSYIQTNDGELQFSTNSGGSDKAVVIDNGGNVGVGTNTPAYQFTVYGSGANMGVISPAGEAIKLTATDDDIPTVDGRGSSGLSLATDGVRALTVLANGGNVGLGTTDPSYRLDVIGTSRIGKESALPTGLSGKLNIIGDDATGIITVNSISSTGNPNVTFFIQPDSNTNSTKIGTFSSSGLKFRTGNSDAITIDTSQNVGIGTTSPSAKLEIIPGAAQKGIVITTNGNTGLTINSTYNNYGPTLTLDATSRGGSKMQFISSGTDNGGGANKTYLYNEESNNVLFASDAETGNFGIGTMYPSSKLDIKGNVSLNNTLYVKENGNVGIGTTDPNFLLEVSMGNNQYATPGLNVLQTEHTTSKRASIGIGLNATLDDGWIIGTDHEADGTNNLWFRDQDQSQTRLLIDANGNVGMGTTSPTTKLTLQGTTLISSGIMFNNTNAGNWRIGPGSAGFTFQNATDNAIKMVINSGGAVGIGTDNPVTVGGTKLNVYGSSPRVLISDNSGTSSILELSSFPTSAYIQTRTSSQTLYIGTANTNRISISGSTGEVTLSTLGTGTVYSNSGLLTNTNPSDIRLKKNIENITNSLEKVNQLRPVTFKWNNTNISSVGFIAQEVNETLPNLVEKNSDGYLGLKTTEFIPYITQAIKELKEENDNLREELCTKDNSYSWC